MKKINKNKIALGLATLVMGFGGNAMAAEQTGTVEVSANILPSCKVSVLENISLQYNPSQSSTQDSIFNVHCTKTTFYHFGINLGNNGLAPSGRNMVSGENKLSYNLYNYPRTSPLDGRDTSVNSNSTGVERTYTFRFIVPENQYVPAGTYTDQLVLTFTY